MTYTDDTLATQPLPVFFWRYSGGAGIGIGSDPFWVNQNKIWSQDSKRAWLGIGAVYAAVIAKWGLAKFGKYLALIILPMLLEIGALDRDVTNHSFMASVAILTASFGWLPGRFKFVPIGLAWYYYYRDLASPGLPATRQARIQEDNRKAFISMALGVPGRSFVMTGCLIYLATFPAKGRGTWWISGIIFAFLANDLFLLFRHYYRRGILEPPYPWDM